MVKVGVTGGLACGKSHVAAVLREKGCEVVNADELGHLAMEPGGPVYEAVLAAFGRDLVDREGRIRRPLLAQRVFGGPGGAAEPGQVARLNALVHPPIMAQVEERCREFARRNPRGILVVDAALIFEASAEKYFEKMIVVDCTPEQQVERFTAKGLGSPEEARQRMAAQLPREEKLRRAHFVVDASGSREETRRQVEAIYDQLLKLT